jgi:hypothetical protein
MPLAVTIDEIKYVPYAPASHPYVEWLIGTIPREYLDRVFFGTLRICCESWTSSRIITTQLAFIGGFPR